MKVYFNQYPRGHSGCRRKIHGCFHRGDAVGVAELYTKQGQVLLSHYDVITGQQGIQMIWRGAMLMGIKGMVLETLEEVNNIR
jgi:ketosteroid isomerase-like protein